MIASRCGRLFVLSAPSGSGKTTVLKALLKSQKNLFRSISVTTRNPRPGERQGRDYRFVESKRFLRSVRRGEFLEYARILGHWYGTPLRPIQRALAQGKDVILGVDIQGARQIRRSGLPVTTIFLLPPSLTTLSQRLRRRGTETPAEVRARLRLAKRELAEVKRYDYAVVNDKLSEAVRRVKAVLKRRGIKFR